MIFTFQYESDALAVDRGLTYCPRVELRLQTTIRKTSKGRKLESWKILHAVTEQGEDVTRLYLHDKAVIEESIEAVGRQYDAILTQHEDHLSA